ncbi:MAG: zf-HC2 domain-containing protein [Candidatus Zixiibacteriota bacterium]
MNCEYFRELMSARLDGELSTDEERQLAEHLAGCPSCRETADQLTELKDSLGSDTPEKMPIGLEKAIFEKTVQKPARKSSLREFIGGYYRVPRGLAWAVLVLFILLAVNSFRGISTPVVEEKVVIESSEQVAAIQKVTLSQDDKVMSKTLTTNKGNI